jgi:hypothetical protein
VDHRPREVLYTRSPLHEKSYTALVPGEVFAPEEILVP